MNAFLRTLAIVVAAVLAAGAALANTVPNRFMFGTAGQPPAMETCAKCHRDPFGGTENLNPQEGYLQLSVREPQGFDGTWRRDVGRYQLVLTLFHPNQIQGGLEVGVLDRSGKQAGTFRVDPTADWYTQTDTDPATPTIQYVHHEPTRGTQRTPGQPGQPKGWIVEWYPPPFNVGPITFYAAAVAGNLGGDPGQIGVLPSGDFVYTLKRTLEFGEPPAGADLDRNGLLDWRDAFFLQGQYQRYLPTPTPAAGGLAAEGGGENTTNSIGFNP